MTSDDLQDALEEAYGMCLMFGNGFIKLSNTATGVELSVVPIQDYKWINLKEDGSIEFEEKIQ